MSARPHSAVKTLVGNLRDARIWQTRDLVNLGAFAREMRVLSAGATVGTGMGRLLLGMLANLSMAYRPCPPGRDSAANMPRILPHGRPRVAHVVDNPEHVSGVRTTLRGWVAAARREALPLEMLYCGASGEPPGFTPFDPVGIFEIGNYDNLRLPVPDVGAVARRLAQGCELVHISTPGPMGLVAMAVARRLNLPVCGTYHTDFPSYAAALTGQPAFGELARSFMRWFYGRMDLVAVPSPSTRDQLIADGFDPDRLRVVGRGVDTSAFSPEWRDDALRASWNGGRRHQLLYVGRVSEEKNLRSLATAFRRLCERRDDTGLVIVGEGPFLREMRDLTAGLPVHFAGVRRGEDLARHYASADLFVFPSETDTFGVVAIEAQASGTPVLVSAVGGPKDCVAHGRSGWVLDRMTPGALCDELHLRLNEPGRLSAMRGGARVHASAQTPEASFRAYWSFNREAHERGQPDAAAARRACA